jgi:uncharacterized protein YegP (UPF0339 family)
MTRQPYATQYPDQAGEHRTRILAANDDVLFVASQGYDNEDDLIIARELARRTLNDEINNDPAYRVRVETLMAQRDAKSAQFPFGSAPAQAPAVVKDAPPRSNLAEALSKRAGIGAPTLDRLFSPGSNENGQS